MTTWTSRNGANTNPWVGIAFGAGLFVAVSSGPTNTNANRIMTSPDGITWTARDAPTGNNNAWSCIAYVTSNSGGIGSAFVAMASNATVALGSVITSLNGTIWTNQTGPSTIQPWSAIASNGNVMTCVSSGSGSGTGNKRNGKCLLSVSPIGSSWTNTNMPSSNGNSWSCLTSRGNGNNFAALAINGNTSSIVTTGPTASTWSTESITLTNVWRGITTNGSIFVGVGDAGAVVTSPTGTTWTAQTAANAYNWSCITYGNGLFVALSTSGTGNRVMTSPDGITWTAQTSAANNAWSAVTYSSSLALFGGVTNDAVTADVMTGVDNSACILEGMKVLVVKQNETNDIIEQYIPIEELNVGDLVKTHDGKSIPIKHIGFACGVNDSFNTRISKKLYKYPKCNFDCLTDDLIVTGGHSRLVTELTDEQKEKLSEYWNRTYKIDDYYLLLATADEKAEVYDVEQEFKIYNIALECSDEFKNFGMFVNGLLIETCSINYLTKHLTLKE